MPDLAATIKHLRTNHNLRISAIDEPDLLFKHCPNLDPNAAEILCRRFP